MKQISCLGIGTPMQMCLVEGHTQLWMLIKRGLTSISFTIYVHNISACEVGDTSDEYWSVIMPTGQLFILI